MMSAHDLKRLARSALFQVPRLYDVVAGERRFVLLHRLGRVHEADFRALATLGLPPRPLVVDIGANIGQSVLSTLTVLPQATVVGFEPNPGTWPSLDRLAARLPSFRYERVALSDAPGRLELHVPAYRGKVMPALASLDREEARGWLSPHTVLGFREEHLELRSTPVDVRCLDDYDLAPDVVKIDVQGYEEAVVRGGWRTLSEHRPVLVVEVPTPALRTLLEQELGYEAREWRGGRLEDSRMVQVNQVFLPPARRGRPAPD